MKKPTSPKKSGWKNSLECWRWLLALGIDWGRKVSERGKGTFKEGWALRWQPEFAVSLIDAAAYGNTVGLAASQMLAASRDLTLAELTGNLDLALLADLPIAITRLLEQLRRVAATTHDTLQLLKALPPLCRIARYGDVRGTRIDSVTTIVHELALRVRIELPGHCSGLDNDAASETCDLIREVTQALGSLDDDSLLEGFASALHKVAHHRLAHPEIKGTATRILRDRGQLDPPEAARLLSLALTVGNPPRNAALWAQGFLAHGGTVLAHDGNEGRRGGLGNSSPSIVRWLGDIRKYFPTAVVQIMQEDAIERLGLHEFLLEPEVLSQAEADVHLVFTLLTLNRAIPAKTRETARQVVRKLVEQLLKKLTQPTRQAIHGALSRGLRNTRPRLREIDWHRTIRANLHHYLPEHRTIIPEKLIGYGRKRSSLKDVVLCIDQSGSMAASVIYSSIFGAVMASMPAVRTRFVVFDTAVVDLTEELDDPVDLLFGTQLGGGTDIHKALRYCEDQVTRPSDTVMVLISDLEEGGNQNAMIATAKRLKEGGMQLITLLALSDEGQPYYSHRHAAQFAALGIPVFACTPDQFPDLMAAALAKRDLQLWARGQGIKTSFNQT